jgi:hypothetical protein
MHGKKHFLLVFICKPFKVNALNYSGTQRFVPYEL